MFHACLLFEDMFIIRRHVARLLGGGMLTVTDCNQPRGPARPGSSGTNDTVVWSELRVVFAEVRITKRNVQQ